MPTTKFGKWSARFLISFLGFFVLGQIAVMTGQKGGETFRDNLYISLPMSFAALSGVLAFVFGALGIFKQKERSVVVFVATGIGLLMLVFLAGEIFGSDH